MIVGIDLGTTNSLASVLQNGEPVLIPNSTGKYMTPSAVSVMEDGSIVVGDVAKARATTYPDRTATSFKRDMGTQRVFRLGGEEFSPQALSALILTGLRADAEAFLGETVNEVVITVPAYFGELQRSATRDAARIANLNVLRIINEPTAAALAYGLAHREDDADIAVIDLGGGTFDVTVLEIVDGIVEIQGSAGDLRLGGDDFTFALAEGVAGDLQSKEGLDLRSYPEAWARVCHAAERAKKMLSDSECSRIVVPNLRLDSRTLSIEKQVTLQDFQESTLPLQFRMRRTILQALRDAGKRPEDLDIVLLVGGATRMASIVDLAADVFGRLPATSLPPDEAVVMGAAVQAGLKAQDAAVSDMIVTDIAPFTLGAACQVEMGPRHLNGVFSPIIERGTVIPASRVDTFYTTQNRQTHMRLQVFQGENSLCKDNTFLGEYTVTDLPKRPAGEVLVHVRFTYDLNGLLDIDLTVDDGETHNFLIDRSTNEMTEAEVEQALDRMHGLKFHPRDALPNSLAIARAEALFQSLSGDLRRELAMHLSAFRLSLAAQDPQEIQVVREALNGFVARFERS